MFALFLSFLIQSNDSSSIAHQVWQELNLVRTQPQAYIKYLEEYKKEFKGYYRKKGGHYSLLTLEGTDAVDEAIAELRELEPLPFLRFSKGLAKACQDHIDDQSITGETGHQGADGLYAEHRAKRYGNWQRTVAENIQYGASTAKEIVISLLVDDAVLDRGHRINILNPIFRVVGIAFGPHKIYGDMCTMTFTAGFIPN